MPEEQKKPVPKAPAVVRTSDFRKDPEKVSRMRRLLEDPILKEWLSAMRESGPDTDALDMESVTPHGAHIRMGEQRGWAKYHNQFCEGGTHLIDKSQSLEAASLSAKLQPED